MILYLVLLSAVAGLVAHQRFFIHGEWHLRTVEIIRAHLGLGVCAFSILFYFVEEASSLSRAASATAAATAVYMTAMFASIAIYRLFFHRTRHFPGPRLAAVSKFWHIFHIRDSRNFLFMERLHRKYGMFVRTGMHTNAIEETVASIAIL